MEKRELHFLHDYAESDAKTECSELRHQHENYVVSGFGVSLRVFIEKMHSPNHYRLHILPLDQKLFTAAYSFY